MTNRNQIILAPHVDDETIGCYSSLTTGRVAAVIYGSVPSPERTREGYECAKKFGHSIYFPQELSVEQILSEFISGWSALDLELLMPTSYDHHAEHLRMNRLGKHVANGYKIKTMYYSVDMNVPHIKPLLDEVATLKEHRLRKLFPTQYRYFDTHEQAWLFESIRDVDRSVRINKEFDKSGLVLHVDAYSNQDFLEARKIIKDHTTFPFDSKADVQVARYDLNNWQSRMRNLSVDVSMSYQDMDGYKITLS